MALEKHCHRLSCTKNEREPCSREQTAQSPSLLPTFQQRRPPAAHNSTICFFCLSLDELSTMCRAQVEEKVQPLGGRCASSGGFPLGAASQKCCSQSLASSSVEMHRPRSKALSVGQSSHAVREFATPRIVIQQCRMDNLSETPSSRTVHGLTLDVARVVMNFSTCGASARTD